MRRNISHFSLSLPIKKNIMRSLSLAFFIFLYLFSSPLFSQLPLVIDNGQFRIDDAKKLILVTKQANHTSIQSSVQLGTSVFSTETAINPIQAGTPYTVKNADMLDYTLYFTDNPIVSINVSAIGDINKDEEIPGSMVLATTTHLPYQSPIGIKIRGASSSTYPKKSYRVQLKDESGKNRNDQLLGMRNDKRWLMLAMYNEPMRNNNKFSHDLWLDMHAPYYLDREPEALSTIRSKYVEAFVNNEYRGVYLFTEDADQKQFGLKGKNEGGELYKGENRGRNNTFIKDYPEGGVNNDYPAISSSGDDLWGGWELRHPGSTDWTAIYDFTEFVLESGNDDFRNNIGTKLHLDSAIDYFIFLNAIMATDNQDKNTLLVKYATYEPYFYGIWDLDGVIGTYWNGDRFPDTFGIFSNGLYDRLLDTNPDEFKLRLSYRWKTLRQGLLSTDNFKARFFGYYQYLFGQGVYQRELMVGIADGNWSMQFLNFSSEQVDFINNWLDARFSYLDNYFENMYQDALPVRLISFNLAKAENLVEVEWKISEAANVGHFTVEHSINGKSGWKSGANVAYIDGQSDYKFIDESPAPGINYYRLKTTDLDGSFEYSSIKSITMEEIQTSRSAVFFPNPVRGVLKYRTENTTKKVAFLSLQNMNGVPVFSQKDTLRQSADVRKLPPGLYLAILDFEDGSREQHKIIIAN